MSELIQDDVLLLYDLLTKFRVISNLLMKGKIHEVRRILSVLLDKGILQREKYESFIFMLTRLKSLKLRGKASQIALKFEHEVLRCITDNKNIYSLIFRTYEILIELHDIGAISDNEYWEYLLKLVECTQNGCSEKEIYEIYSKLREKIRKPQKAS